MKILVLTALLVLIGACRSEEEKQQQQERQRQEEQEVIHYGDLYEQSLKQEKD